MLKLRELLEWIWGSLVPFSISVLFPRGPFLAQFSVFILGTSIAVLLSYFEIVAFSCIADFLLDLFGGFIEWVFSPLDAIARWVHIILKLPLPGPQWKPMLICAAFVHGRAAAIEFYIGGDRKVTAHLTIFLLVIIAVPVTYAASILNVGSSSVGIMGLILTVFAVIEVLRNSVLAYYRRFPPSQTLISSLQYYHRRITAINLLACAISILSTIIFSFMQIRGAWVLGFVVFLAMHAFAMFYASLWIQKRDSATFQGWYRSSRNTARISHAWSSLDTIKIVFWWIALNFLASSLSADFSIFAC